MLPAVLVIVTVDIPVAAVLLAVSVKVLIALVGVVGFVLNDAVTPFGRPDAAKLTFPVKPFWGATVMRSEERGVWEEGRSRWAADSLKKGVPPAAFTVRTSEEV